MMQIKNRPRKKSEDGGIAFTDVVPLLFGRCITFALLCHVTAASVTEYAYAESILPPSGSRTHFTDDIHTAPTKCGAL